MVLCETSDSTKIWLTPGGRFFIRSGEVHTTVEMPLKVRCPSFDHFEDPFQLISGHLFRSD